MCAPLNQLPQSADWVADNSEDDETVVVEQLTDVMLRHSVPDDITDQVISCATVLAMTDAGAALTAALEHLYSRSARCRQKAARQAIMLVGPPGAGKTLADRQAGGARRDDRRLASPSSPPTRYAPAARSS